MRSLLLLAVFLASCNFDASTSAAPANSDPFAPDAMNRNAPDADPNAPDASTVLLCDDWNLQPSILDPCADIQIEEEDLTLTLDGLYRYNTLDGKLTDRLGVDVAHVSTTLGAGARAPRVVVAANFWLGPQAELRVVGPRPLIIVSWGGMLVEGNIDVSSSSLGGTGAGADSELCVAATPGTDDSDGSGGGGGGGFGEAGGVGGLGRSPNEDIAGGLGGEALELAFHGGCPGAAGGDDDNPSKAGDGAPGGGALYLLARNSLNLRGHLYAGGQGGFPATGSRAGGGGGGSGGMIALESHVLTLQADSIVVANGGGGGGGANGDGDTTTPTAGAPGGDGVEGGVGGIGENPPEGDGGDGGKLLNNLEDQNGLLSSRGGGGAGGAVGYILLLTNNLTNNSPQVSPLPTTTSISSE